MADQKNPREPKWQDVWAAEKAFKAAHDAEVRRFLEAAGVDPNVIYDAFHNGSILGRAAAREALTEGVK